MLLCTQQKGALVGYSELIRNESQYSTLHSVEVNFGYDTLYSIKSEP